MQRTFYRELQFLTKRLNQSQIRAMGNKPVHIVYCLTAFVHQLMNRIGYCSHHPTEYFPSVLDNAIVVAQLLLAESIGKPCPINMDPTCAIGANMMTDESLKLVISFHENGTGGIAKQDAGCTIRIICNFGQRFTGNDQNLPMQSRSNQAMSHDKSISKSSTSGTNINRTSVLNLKMGFN
ncbi:hypothetical protein VE23_12770 [Paenibacillus sp. D9]|nr:hypothetical protein VE23_12770 [Paenibacillus sp. D9]